MLLAIVFILLFIIEICYFKIADRYNIIDKPNLRSSHSTITLRGGGIIFAISVLVYFLLFGFHYFWFTCGMVAIAAVSFADDIKHQPRKLRLSIQFLAVCMLLYKVGIFYVEWYWWIVAFVLIVGITNAYNFMDGINGITTAYSFTVLAGLYFLNKQLPEYDRFDENLVLCLALGNLVFAFFNFRTKAKCFAGDVGSVSMAYALLFLGIWCVLKTNNFIFILFFALYGVDTVLTILHRLYKRENIFEPHRQHLFQYLANEQKIPQLVVSTIYMVGQSIITAGVLYVWKQSEAMQWAFAAIALGIPTILHVVIKYRILKSVNGLQVA
jgi:UDP-GlcNAc:undecaprenyl-phosphate GlcNAc-1-phosphate transferase